MSLLGVRKRLLHDWFGPRKEELGFISAESYEGLRELAINISNSVGSFSFDVAQVGHDQAGVPSSSRGSDQET